jgi:hypothetical protein
MQQNQKFKPMTLTEYLNQGDSPKRFPNVKLEFSEVLIYKVGKMYSITIPSIEAKFKTKHTYFAEAGSAILWTTDEDGNKRKISCFSLNFDHTLLNLDSPFNPIK